MSIALLVKYKDDAQEDLYIPVSTEKFFFDYWIPIAERGNCELVKKISHGLKIDESIKENLLDELFRIKNSITDMNYGYDVREHLESRIDTLIDFLKSLNEDNVSVYLG